MLHANVVALYFIEPELMPIEVLYCDKDFGHVCSCDLDLDPITFMYEWE